MEKFDGVQLDTDKKPQYLQIHSAVKKIENTVDRLRELGGRICGEIAPPENPDKAMKEPQVTLKSVLENTPDNLYKINEELSNIISVIEELLFK